MSAKDLINWGELSRLLSGDRMNIRKNRIPQKYEAATNYLIKHLQDWETEFQNGFEKTEAGGQKENKTVQTDEAD